MKNEGLDKQSDRKDRLLQERVHDPLEMRLKPKEPVRCPRCALVYHKGRWQKGQDGVIPEKEQMCSACHRVVENYPAGEVTLSGESALERFEEIESLARHTEASESEEHPLNRIIAIQRESDSVRITTTDVHLPGRIGKAIQRAFGGEMKSHFDEGGHFASVHWQSGD